MDLKILTIMAQVAVRDAKAYLAEDADMETVAKQCFQSARPEVCWMGNGTDDHTFRIGVAALTLYYPLGSKERERVADAYRPLQAISAAISGVPVDFDRLKAPEKTIPLLGLYHESKEKES